MIEQTGNLWEGFPDYRVITTNGSIRSDGHAVMGRGVAQEAAQRYPDLPMRLGATLKKKGNHVFFFRDLRIVTFPVKHQWMDRADLGLIKRSAQELARLSSLNTTYWMVRPGCGNGRLLWADVRPILEFLPDNFVIRERG